MSGRKPRADAKLRNLPSDQRTALTDWLVDEGMSYKDAKRRLKDEFGLSTSIGAIGDFWQKECFSLRFSKARSQADELVELMRESDSNFDEVTLHAIGQRAFDLSVSKEANVQDLAALAKIMGDSARLQLQQRKLELDLDKWRAAAKTEIEKGLDALYDEIKGNPEAMELFGKMKAIVLKSVKEAKA